LWPKGRSLELTLPLGQRRVSHELHQTFSLWVPVNGLWPVSLATSAFTVAALGL